MTYQHSRRSFLRHVGMGSMLIGSLGTRLVSNAWAQTRRKNLVIYANVNGLVRDHAPTLGDTPGQFDLGSFDPLNAIKDELTWIQHLNNPFSLQLHGNWWPLTGVSSYGGDKSNENPGGPSIDRVIARAVGGLDPFSSLAFSTDSATNVQGRKARARGGWLDGGIADGRGAPFPAIHDPAEAVTRIFGEGTEPPPPPDVPDDRAQRQAGRQRRVIDLVLPDARRLSGRLAAPERVVLEQYLSSLESIEQRLEQVESQPPRPVASPTCARPDARSFSEIAPLAIACGMTSVVTILVDEDNHSSWWHGTTPVSWYHNNANNILTIWNGMKDLGIADDSAILWLSKNGGGHHRSSHQLQAMVVGTLGGALGPGGRTLRFDATSKGGSGGQHIQSLFIALARAMSPSIESFAGYSEPLPGLLV